MTIESLDTAKKLLVVTTVDQHLQMVNGILTPEHEATFKLKEKQTWVLLRTLCVSTDKGPVEKSSSFLSSTGADDILSTDNRYISLPNQTVEHFGTINLNNSTCNKKK